MQAKLELVDYIEGIKEKLTSQEYKDILEKLADIKVSNSNTIRQKPNSEPEPRRVHEVIDWSPSGFAIPTIISPELARFIGVEVGTLVARPDVTIKLTKYIRDNNLQNPENRRIIELDKPGGQALRDLLQVPQDAELTFFNLQRYLRIHYPRPN